MIKKIISNVDEKMVKIMVMMRKLYKNENKMMKMLSKNIWKNNDKMVKKS